MVDVEALVCYVVFGNEAVIGDLLAFVVKSELLKSLLYVCVFEVIVKSLTDITS